MVTSTQHSERSSRATATRSGPASSRLDKAAAVGARRVDEAAALGAPQVAPVLGEPGGARGRHEWLRVVGDCQSLINTLTAVQDAAIAEAARRESVWCEDGTLGETVHGPGRVSLDAADVVAPVIGASHAQAQRRVEQAVRMAAGRLPVAADDRDVPEASGLGRLHEAMAAGHLDAYRAGVVAFELDGAPAAVADAVVSALDAHLDDDAPGLRRRTRVLLSHISPDLVRERARRARASTGLRRWVAEPGVDEWHGTFPSEDAAAAWAAIDRLAHDLVAAGTCSNVEQARGKALTDLVTGNATVDVQVVLTVPAGIGSPDRPAAGTDSLSAATQLQEPMSTSEEQVVTTYATSQPPATTASASAAATTHVTDQPSATTASSQARDQDDDLLEVQGARPSEPLFVRRSWLRDHLPNAPTRPRRGAQRARPPFVPCDPLTGARLDPGDHLATDTYRPGDELAALVRARDGRCRFPGCSIAARSCDLDHVRPWPLGRTAAPNLLTLCRRHHRIKQRPGWRLRLAADGTAIWTDPNGRERTTAPLNALQSLVLRTDPVTDECHNGPEPATEILATRSLTPDGCDLEAASPAPVGAVVAATPAWSALETHLALRLEHDPGQFTEHDPRTRRTHRTHRRCTSAADLRAGSVRRRARAPVPDRPPF